MPLSDTADPIQFKLRDTNSRKKHERLDILFCILQILINLSRNQKRLGNYPSYDKILR